MDWNVMVQYLPQYEKAAWLTLRLGVAGIFWAILVGLVCAVLQYEKVPVLRRIVGAYIQLSRNTPLLVQLFFLYYGLPKIGIKTNAELCGIAGLAFLGGSYMAEAFRSGLEAIEPIRSLRPTAPPAPTRRLASTSPCLSCIFWPAGPSACWPVTSKRNGSDCYGRADSDCRPSGKKLRWQDQCSG